MRKSLFTLSAPASLLAVALALPLSLPVSLPVSAAATVNSEQAADSLQQQIAANLPFSATFSQKVTDPDGNLLQSASGQSLISDGGRFRWETFSPDESLVISDGETVWVYNPFVEQVTIMDLSQALENTPALLLSTTAQSAWQQYTIEQSGNSYLLHPRGEGSMIEWLKLSFEQGKLTALAIHDIQGQTNNVTFTSQALPSEMTFDFTVPDFADVDDRRQ